MVCEAGAERNLRQAEFAVSPHEVLRSFNAARDYIPVRRQAGSSLEGLRWPGSRFKRVLSGQVKDGTDATLR